MTEALERSGRKLSVDRGAMHSGAGIGCRKRGEIETQGLQGRLQRAERRGLAFDLINEATCLFDEGRVAFARRNLVPRPVFVAEPKNAPAAVMKLNLQTALRCIELQGTLVRRLELVQRVIHEYVPVTSTEVDRVFDRNFRQHQVGAVANNAVCRTEYAFDPVRGMRERVLDGSATGFSIPIIGF